MALCLADVAWQQRYPLENSSRKGAARLELFGCDKTANSDERTQINNRQSAVYMSVRRHEVEGPSSRTTSLSPAGIYVYIRALLQDNHAVSWVCGSSWNPQNLPYRTVGVLYPAFTDSQRSGKGKYEDDLTILGHTESSPDDFGDNIGINIGTTMRCWLLANVAPLAAG